MNEALRLGERALWQGQPDGRTMMWRFLWWIGIPWLLLTAIAISEVAALLDQFVATRVELL